MTMYRYLALMWSPTNREAACVAKYLAETLHETSPHQWSLAWDGDGLAIFHSGARKGRMQTYRLQGERGAILGRLFRNDYSSVVDDLDESESLECLATSGQHLIDNYWGRYVAILNDPEGDRRCVLRDPSGQFPCFHTEFKGATIYFSDMQDAANFDFLPFTVNWDFLKTNIVLPQFRTMHTGLNEVGEVQPGECVQVTRLEKKSQFLWNPTQISETDVVEDPENAAMLLRETVTNTVAALSGCYNHIIHNLGGLDSSIVLACMAQAPKRPTITCLSFHTKSPRGEERRYSRQVAEMYGVEFVDRELDYRKVNLNRLFVANKLPKPRAIFDGFELTGDALALTAETGAEALTFGTGGDNVYYQAPFNLGALDYVRRHGLLGRGALRIAMESSRYSRKSLFRTLGNMVRERFAPAACYEYVHAEFFANYRLPFVNPDFIAGSDFERFIVPFQVPDRTALKGKYLHIFGSTLCTNEYYHHHDTQYSVERVRAYFTQPIIEACLRIPSWVMTHRGIDRGLARKAFSHKLPHAVARRLTKSTPSEFYRDIYQHNADFLRRTLLGGRLAKEGVLLPSLLEDAFNKARPSLRVWHSQLLGYVEVEAWLQAWMERPVRKSQMT